MPDNFIRKPNCNCFKCNSSIYRRPKQIARGPVFCSIACSRAYHVKTKKCPVCQEGMPAWKSIKTCSRSCANTLRKGIKYDRQNNRNKYVNLKATKKRLIALRGGKCEECAYSVVPGILHVHHKIPRAKGGTNELSNLQLLCPNCHAIKHFNVNEQDTQQQGSIQDQKVL